jgi:hypothetical protein
VVPQPLLIFAHLAFCGATIRGRPSALIFPRNGSAMRALDPIGLPRLPEWYDRLVGLCLLKSSNLCLNKLKNRHRVHGGIIVHDYFVTILEKVLSCCIPPRQKSFPGSV